MTHPELTWHTVAQLVVRVRKGGRVLGVVVQGEREAWTVMALEGPEQSTRDALPSRVQSLFDDHGHKMVGVFPSPSDAMVVAESYANAWFYGDAKTMERCCCRSIREGASKAPRARAARPASVSAAAVLARASRHSARPRS
jgi:hypothetical protein